MARRKLREFQRAILAECQARGIPPGVEIPTDLVGEVVTDLYGGWTDKARRYVRATERAGRAVNLEPS